MVVNGMYQELHDQAKEIIKQDACVKFYIASKPLYLETCMWYQSWDAIAAGKRRHELWE